MAFSNITGQKQIKLRLAAEAQRRGSGAYMLSGPEGMGKRLIAEEFAKALMCGNAGPDGACGVISFGIKGGRASAVKFMDSLKLAAIVVHVADARTCVLHPASTTHRQLTDEQLVDAGIGADLIRMSVGIENVDDIIDDIKQALSEVECNAD